MNTDFYRIKRLPPYIFEEVNRLKAAARAYYYGIRFYGFRYAG